MENIENFQKLVLAGMKILYDKKVFERTKNGMLRKSIPLPQRLAVETAGLMHVLQEKSNGKIPPKLLAPAAAMLLMELSKFMAEAGIEEATPEQIRQGIEILMGMLKKMFAKGGQPPSPQGAPSPQPPPPAPGGIMQQGV